MLGETIYNFGELVSPPPPLRALEQVLKTR